MKCTINADKEIVMTFDPRELEAVLDVHATALSTDDKNLIRCSVDSQEHFNDYFMFLNEFTNEANKAVMKMCEVDEEYYKHLVKKLFGNVLEEEFLEEAVANYRENDTVEV